MESPFELFLSEQLHVPLRAACIGHRKPSPYRCLVIYCRPPDDLRKFTDCPFYSGYQSLYECVTMKNGYRLSGLS